MDSIDLNVGDVKYLRMLGQHFAVFRTEDGKVGIIDAYCPHLGANIGVGGKIIGNNIQCPFHGWTFSKDGSCVNIPYCDKIPSIAKTTAWKVEECNAGIYIWHDAEKREPSWIIPKIPENMYYHGRTVHYVSAHIQEIPENGADVAHLNIVHVDFVEKALSFIFTHEWTGEWTPCTEPSKEHMAFLEITMRVKLFNKFNVLGTQVKVHVTQMGPGVVQLYFDTPLGRLIVIETVTPLEPLLQMACHTIFAEWKIPRFIVKFVLRGLAIQYEKDMPIWNNKTYVASPIIVKGDGNIGGFRRWYSKFYSENSAKFAKDSLEW